MSTCEVCGESEKPSFAQDWPVPFRLCSESCVDEVADRIVQPKPKIIQDAKQGPFLKVHECGGVQLCEEDKAQLDRIESMLKQFIEKKGGV